MQNFLQNKYVEIKLENNWYRYKNDTACCFFCGYLLDKNLEKSEAAKFLLNKYLDNEKTFEKNIKELIGNFSFIIIKNNSIISAVDLYGSFPIYYSKSFEKIYIYSNPLSLKNKLNLNSINFSSSFFAARTGFVLSDNTLLNNIKFVEAGKYLIIENNVVNKKTYFQYYPEIDKIYKNDQPENFRISELSSLCLKIFSDLIKNANNRQIVIFLSGGYDSRLIACGLKKLGYTNVLCVSYGIKNNWEAYIGKKVANKLNYKWKFVEAKLKDVLNFYQSEVFKNYIKLTDSLTSVHVINELFVLNKIRSSIDKNAIIINGQTGDFITGAHIPIDFSKDLKKDDTEIRKNRFLDVFIKKHCSLWDSLNKNKEDLLNLKNKIWANLNSEIKISSNQKYDYQLYEYYEWKTRQSTYLVRNQKVYEFLQFDWRLPLWDQRLVQFFLYSSFKEKINQNLYKNFLHKENWCNVWNKYPEKWYVQGKVSILRLIIKYSVGVLIGRKFWKILDKKIFYWWHDNLFISAIIPYKTWLFDKRGPRSAVSYLTEKWLKSHQIDWRGNKNE